MSPWTAESIDQLIKILLDYNTALDDLRGRTTFIMVLIFIVICLQVYTLIRQK